MRHNLKNFELKEICTLNDPELENTYNITNPGTKEIYLIGEKPLKIFATPSVTVKNQPVVIGRDGLLWDLACYYLVDLAVQQASDPSSIQKYAVHLAEFYDYCLENDINPLLDTPSKRKKPIKRFKHKLEGQILNGELAGSTASNKIGNIVRFYRWLIDDYGYVFKHRPFFNESILISYIKASGNIVHKSAYSHDNRIKSIPNSDLPSENFIIDDGRLRPLSPSEQEVLLNILSKHKNTEMLLIFLFALTTGARIQSILTLRHKHFRFETDPVSSVPLAIGHGTLVDSKNSKKQVLVIPASIQHALATYSHSERAKRRFKKYCKLRDIETTQGNFDNCYLFLTNHGHPYYDAKSDLFTYDKSQKRTNLRNGDSVRKFIKRQLLPPMKEAFGCSYHLMFHYLRATYGMNLVDACNKLVNEGKMPASEVLPFVQSRMNHSDPQTTERYIKYREKNKHSAKVIKEYQDTLLDRIDGLLGKTLSMLDPNYAAQGAIISTGLSNA